MRLISNKGNCLQLLHLSSLMILGFAQSTTFEFPLYDKSALTNCKTQSAASFSIIYCDQRYLQFKNSDPIGTLESVTTPRLISAKQNPDNQDLLYTVSTLMEGSYMQFEGDRIVKSDKNIMQGSITQIIEEFMIVDSGRGIGMVKFNSNQFATFIASSSDGTPVKYMSTRNFQGLTDYQFDYSKKVLYVGNGTDIIRYQIQIDSSPTSGQITGVTFVQNQTNIPQRFNHTSFRVLSDSGLMVVSCTTCNQSQGLIQFINITSNANNSFKVIDTIRGSTNKSQVMIGERFFIERLAPSSNVIEDIWIHYRLVYTTRQTMNGGFRDIKQAQYLISTNNDTILSRAAENITLNLTLNESQSMSFSNGKLFYISVNATNFITPKFVQQCTIDSQLTQGTCNTCPSGQGQLDGQCQPCLNLALSSDPFNQALSYKICSNPYFIQIPQVNNTPIFALVNQSANLQIQQQSSALSTLQIILITVIPSGVIIIVIAIIVYCKCSKKSKQEQSKKKDDQREEPIQTCQRDLLHTNGGDDEKNMASNVIVTTAAANVETERAKKVTPRKQDDIVSIFSPRPKYVQGDDSQIQKPSSSFSHESHIDNIRNENLDQIATGRLYEAAFKPKVLPRDLMKLNSPSVNFDVQNIDQTILPTLKKNLDTDLKQTQISAIENQVTIDTLKKNYATKDKPLDEITVIPIITEENTQLRLTQSGHKIQSSARQQLKEKNDSFSIRDSEMSD